MFNTLWEGLTALGTLFLAIATFCIVYQGQRQRKDDSQRHEDGFRPICVLMPYDGVDLWHKRGALLAICDDSSSNPEFGIIELRCTLRNVGPGPALNVAMMFRFLDMGGYTTAPWELSPLYAGECRGGENNPLRIPIQFRDRFNKTDFSQVVGKSWELLLVFEDVFGNHFYSVHHKSPIQLDNPPAAVPQHWVTIGKGRLPK